MTDTLMERTALGSEIAGLRSQGRAELVVLREMPPAAMIDLRLDPADSAALNAAERALSLKLPLTPGKSAGAAGCLALWFGPDQWLVVGKAVDVAGLQRALASMEASAGEVSDLRAEFELAGPHAADVLRKGCAIDLHPRAFAPGDCVITSLARVRVAFRQADGGQSYRLFVERSYASYLWDWLADAMIEYGGG